MSEAVRDEPPLGRADESTHYPSRLPTVLVPFWIHPLPGYASPAQLRTLRELAEEIGLKHNRVQRWVDRRDQTNFPAAREIIKVRDPRCRTQRVTTRPQRRYRYDRIEVFHWIGAWFYTRPNEIPEEWK